MRLEKLDILRWIAIIMMVLFHLNYSLVNIFSSNVLNFSEIFWFYIWKIAAILFISIAGISFYLAEKKYWKYIYRKYFRYALALSCIALLISICTYLYFPEQYIRFGIIHFFALSFFILPLFIRFGYMNIILWAWIILSWLFISEPISNEYLYWLWFIYPGFSSADYYPLIPYFWVILIWYALWYVLDRFSGLIIFQKKGQKNKLEKALIFSWRKSLLIYLIHQPIILGVIYLYRNIDYFLFL